MEIEIEVIRDNYIYRYEVCPNCGSELKIKRNTVKYHYSKGYNIADVKCPCCNKGFYIQQ